MRTTMDSCYLSSRFIIYKQYSRHCDIDKGMEKYNCDRTKTSEIDLHKYSEFSLVKEVKAV
jgi:hypothetical protein